MQSPFIQTTEVEVPVHPASSFALDDILFRVDLLFSMCMCVCFIFREKITCERIYHTLSGVHHLVLFQTWSVPVQLPVLA